MQHVQSGVGDASELHSMALTGNPRTGVEDKQQVMHEARSSDPRRTSTAGRVKQHSAGQNAAALLASYRKRAQQTQDGSPAIPTRTTSKIRPAKRKRHEDYIAFHKHSCHLFSSLDGTLAQMRLSTSSSSGSSSSSRSTISSSPSSPTAETGTRETSIDDSSIRSGCSPTTIASSNIATAYQKPQITRPTLHRSQPANRHPPTRTSSTLTTHPSASETTTIPILTPTTPPVSDSPSSTPSTQHTPPTPPKSRPPITTTTSYISTTTSSSPLPSISTTPIQIHWTSPETRQKEYAKIDAAHSGMRLFLRLIFPKALCGKLGGGRRDFWAERDGVSDDDGGSVRRFRVGSGVDDADEENEKVGSELVGTEDKAVSISHIPVEHDSGPDQNQSWDEKNDNLHVGNGMKLDTRADTGFSARSTSSVVRLLSSSRGTSASAASDRIRGRDRAGAGAGVGRWNWVSCRA